MCSPIAIVSTREMRQSQCHAIRDRSLVGGAVSSDHCRVVLRRNGSSVGLARDADVTNELEQSDSALASVRKSAEVEGAQSALSRPCHLTTEARQERESAHSITNRTPGEPCVHEATPHDVLERRAARQQLFSLRSHSSFNHSSSSLSSHGAPLHVKELKS